MPDHHFNTPDEILRFARLSFEVVKVEEVEDALGFATDLIDFQSPLTDDERSIRIHPIRKRAEAYIATAELYDKIGPFLALTTPGKQILSSLGISIGTDFPTPVDFQNAMARAADRYRALGERLLKQIRPVTAGIEASTPLDEIE